MLSAKASTEDFKQGTRIKGIHYYGKVSALKERTYRYPKELAPEGYEITLTTDLEGAPFHTKCIFINNDESISISKSRLIRRVIDQLNDKQMLVNTVKHLFKCKMTELTESDYEALHEYYQFEFKSKLFANEYGQCPPVKLEITRNALHNYTYKYVM